MNPGDRYAGMTVNERLFEAGLLAAFDAAGLHWNERELRKIFAQIDLPHYVLEQLKSGS